MNWIMIALLSGNLIASQHSTEEACRGRLAMVIRNHKGIAYGDCTELKHYSYNTGTIIWPGK